MDEGILNKNVVLIGSFSGGNYGDTLVLFSILDYLQRKGISKVVIPATDPETTKKLIGDKFPEINVICIDINMKRTIGFRFFNRNLIKFLPNTDLVIFTAGTIFFRELFNPRTNFVFSVFLLLPYLKKYKIKLMGLFVGVNDNIQKLSYFKTKLARKFFSSFHLIITRDSFSHENVVKNKLLINAYRAYDIGLYSLIQKYSEKPQMIDSVDNRQSNLGINICEYLGKQVGKEVDSGKLIQFLNSLGSGFDRIYWFHTTKRDETFVCEKLLPYLTNDIVATSKHLPLYKDSSLEENYLKISLFLGMRMHSLIPAIAYRIPSLAMNYNNKVKCLYKDLEGEDSVIELDELCTIDVSLLKIKAFVLGDNKEREIKSLVDNVRF